MAYYNNYQEEKSPKFNAGQLFTVRIHRLQNDMNNAKTNLLAFNEERGCWNFELWFNSLNSLLDEAWPKFIDEEKEFIAAIKKAIVDFLIKYPIYEKISGRVYPYRSDIILNQNNWKITYEALSYYDNKLREYMDEHNLNNPNEWDDDEGL